MSLIAREEYQNALRKGRLKYFSRITRGKPGFILSLEDLSSQMEIVSEEDVGYEYIPINRIIGTWSRARATMFTQGFLPLATSDRSEFASKWCELYSAHLEEGIRDPIKVYEYLNWYYVIEGNKRVSVLNFVGAVSVYAKVIRQMPRRLPMTKEKQIYFDFLDFRRESGMRELWLKRTGGFQDLLEKMNSFHPPKKGFHKNRYDYINRMIYQPFRDIFHSLGAQKKLEMTTGDAFLRYIEIFGWPEKIDPEKSRKKITRLMNELILEEASIEEDTDTEEIQKEKGGLGQLYSLVTGQKKTLKILFLYARSPEESGWTYAHEAGRRYIQEKLEDRIETSSINAVPENDDAFNTISTGIKDGYDLIFATSPYFENAILKASLEYPTASFYTCSPGKSRQRVRNYFGQSFEPSFLAGILAALINKDGRIGYIASGFGIELYSRINSFVQGARLINPDCHIPLLWNDRWDNPAYARKLARYLLEKHCSTIFQHSIPIPGNLTGEYGLYDLSGRKNGSVRHYGATRWDWGKLYLRIVENILSGSSDGFKQTPGASVPMNFWGGLRSGTVDFVMNDFLIPPKTRQMIEMMRFNLIHSQIHPFTGPIHDINDELMIPEGTQADLNMIRSMEWLCEGIVDLRNKKMPGYLRKL